MPDNRAALLVGQVTRSELPWPDVSLREACVYRKSLYEASRVKRFFAINISSLPTFQEGAVLH
jgi:hypothetical protein